MNARMLRADIENVREGRGVNWIDRVGSTIR